MKLEYRLGLLRLQNDITSCVDIYMQQDKQLGGDAGGRRVVGLNPVSSGFHLVAVQILNLVWIQFVPSQSEQLHDWPM